jgi:acyl carrier protein
MFLLPAGVSSQPFLDVGVVTERVVEVVKSFEKVHTLSPPRFLLLACVLPSSLLLVFVLAGSHSFTHSFIHSHPPRVTISPLTNPSFLSLSSLLSSPLPLQVDASKVSAEARFKEDLDLDSLDAVEISLQLEEEFSIQIPDSEADNILSIPDAVKYISGHPMAR